MKHAPMFCAAMLASMPALALAAIDPAKVCDADADGRLQAHPIKLLNAALSAGGSYPSGYFDTDCSGKDGCDGSESLEEKFSALFSEPIRCEDKDVDCNTKQISMAAARDTLTSFLEDVAEVKPLRAPTAQEISDRPYLGHEATATLAMALDERGRFVRVICKPLSTDTAAADEEDAPNRWRITGDIDGLALPRGGEDDLAAVPQATVSYVSDRESRKRTFDVDAVVGRAFEPSERTKLIPFVAFRRQVVETRDPSAGTSDTTGSSEWNLGLLYSHRTKKSNTTFDLAALYTAETEHDSRIVGVEANWKPGALYRNERLPFGGARPYAFGRLKINAQIGLQAGDVIDAGTNAELADEGAYARIGPSLQFTFWPHALPRFRADAAYKRWFRIGDTRGVEWLDAGVSYGIDPEGHYLLRYSYQHGRDEETLERIRRWTLSFGVRY